MVGLAGPIESFVKVSAFEQPETFPISSRACAENIVVALGSALALMAKVPPAPGCVATAAPEQVAFANTSMVAPGSPLVPLMVGLVLEDDGEAGVVLVSTGA